MSVCVCVHGYLFPSYVNFTTSCVGRLDREMVPDVVDGASFMAKWTFELDLPVPSATLVTGLL